MKYKNFTWLVVIAISVVVVGSIIYLVSHNRIRYQGSKADYGYGYGPNSPSVVLLGKPHEANNRAYQKDLLQIKYNSSVDLRWIGSNVQVCHAGYGDQGGSWTEQTSTTLSKPVTIRNITKQTIFKVNCTSADGTLASSALVVQPVLGYGY